jgi:hypothetical protein
LLLSDSNFFVEYINEYDRRIDLIAKYRKEKSSFSKHLDAKKEDGIEELASLMICPVQRIPRYLLLLRELLKCTPESHHERKDLEDALKIVERSCQHVNNTKKDQDNSVALLSLQSKISSYSSKLVVPGRKLICKFSHTFSAEN